MKKTMNKKPVPDKDRFKIGKAPRYSDRMSARKSHVKGFRIEVKSASDDDIKYQQGVHHHDDEDGDWGRGCGNCKMF